MITSNHIGEDRQGLSFRNEFDTIILLISRVINDSPNV